ncbi:hypothetical protein MAPG_06343 [Magnaporthiopsis poae ATCC 64411]|uniref:Uncharacterized protein n=1 Tax=Magnaporthiopsis poae (strain ATCC 64411 / 73-15) TaxID=644358 RepID=A0A0C4E1S4_MAGP6|nr:hypothetical protein MAPG_06343 [Magnaporthiopsis poae ATCC 64411]
MVVVVLSPYLAMTTQQTLHRDEWRKGICYVFTLNPTWTDTGGGGKQTDEQQQQHQQQHTILHDATIRKHTTTHPCHSSFFCHSLLAGSSEPAEDFFSFFFFSHDCIDIFDLALMKLGIGRLWEVIVALIFFPFSHFSLHTLIMFSFFLTSARSHIILKVVIRNRSRPTSFYLPYTHTHAHPVCLLWIFSPSSTHPFCHHFPSILTLIRDYMQPHPIFFFVRGPFACCFDGR